MNSWESVPFGGIMGIRALLLLVCFVGNGPATFAAEPTKADSSDKARIVFMRIKQGIGADTKADLLEVVAGQPQFIARLAQGEKLILDVPRGQRQFMTMGFGGTADFLYVDLLAGKTYYVVLHVHGGTGGITPVPVRADSRFPPESSVVVAGIQTYKLITPTQSDKEQFARERTTVQASYERATRNAARRSGSERSVRTVHPEDSIGGSAQPLTPVAIPAAATPPSTPASVPSPKPVQEGGKPDSQAARRLEELKILLDRGLISGDEYQEKRKAILKDL